MKTNKFPFWIVNMNTEGLRVKVNRVILYKILEPDRKDGMHQYHQHLRVSYVAVYSALSEQTLQMLK